MHNAKIKNQGKNMNENKSKNILVVSAHADDMEFMCAGTVAKMISKGHEAYLIIATNNEKGSFTIPKEILVERSREHEAKKAAEFLGIKDVVFFNYKDGELGDVPVNVLREKIMKYARKIKADVLMTWDPFAPFESHPDHRQVSIAALEAGRFAHFPLFHPEHKEQGILPHYVWEYYFFAKHPVHINKIVDISGFIENKVTALLMHKSQMELTVDDIIVCLKAAGINPEHAGIPEKPEPEMIDSIISMRIREHAAKIGEKANFQYAEEFRYEAFGMVGDLFPELIKKEDI
jgi:LmbE family N-acetylglucosaminyl deacetylase